MPSHKPADRQLQGRTSLTQRTLLLVSSGLSAILLAQSAHAQTPTEPATETRAPAPSEEIIVTGSRIARDGYQAPTPVSVMSSADIEAQAPANISDFVNQMPSIAGSQTAGTSSGGLSNGIAGIAALNLRGLGTNRTLVLVDGQRSVASSVTGQVDINTIPQDLVERVEVVTGGASAAYGSDAVGGVVNFILRTKYEGLKLGADTGITTYGDAPNYRFSATAGKSFLDGRLHVVASGEYFRQIGVDRIDRDWNNSGFFMINNPAYVPGNGQPQRLVTAGAGPSMMTPGGLITSGPLRGTYFGQINPATGTANTGQLNYGNVLGQWMTGGDWQYTLSNHVGTNSLAPDEERIAAFGRVSFEVTPSIEVFAQGSFNRYNGKSFYQQTPNIGNVTIRADNAFLPQSVRDALAANNLSSFTMGTSNAGIPPAGSDNTRKVERYVVGAKGDLGLFSKDFKWDIYYQKGIARLHEELTNSWNNARMALAQDAVYGPGGGIVCRSTLTNPTNGCVPLNRIGIGGITQEALDYIFTDGQPYRNQKIQQDVVAGSMSGEIFDLPAGPVSIAFGGEWRKEQVSGDVPAEYQTGWLYGNYKVNRGSYNVAEGFVELAVPVFTGFDLNGAFRYTHYSLSGDVQTWKVGGTWQPIEDIRIRGNVSRDIRAPNLNELFAAGTARTNNVNLPDGTSVQILEVTQGNLALKPEKANSWTVGTVLTPRFAPGFTLSVDYYEIKIDGAIDSITAQRTADMCYEQGLALYCNNITYGPNGLPTQILLSPFNFARNKARGFDFEATYRLPMDVVQASIPGTFSVHAAVNHAIERSVDNGFDAAIDYAGSITPKWSYRVQGTYDADSVVFNLIGRGTSAGTYNNNWIECTSACPVSTADYRTINSNHFGGAFYLDTSIGFRFDTVGDGKGQIMFIVNNLLNKDPVLYGNGPDSNNATSYAQTARTLYDVMGRTFRVSAKLEF